MKGIESKDSVESCPDTRALTIGEKLLIFTTHSYHSCALSFPLFSHVPLFAVFPAFLCLSVYPLIQLQQYRHPKN